MPTTSFGTSAEFSRLVNSTTARFFKEEENNVLKRRRLTAAIQAKGRVKKNEYGDELKWPVRYKRTPLVTIGDVVNLNFPRQNKDKVAVLPWVGYAVTDSRGEKEKVLNQGPAAILRQTSLLMTRLKDDITDGFALELYKDSNATSGVIAGLETPCTHSAATANNKARTPNATYAGHSCAPGLLGTWSGSWPDGSGDAEYEWWSPLILDAGGSGFSGGSSTWAADAVEILRYGIFAMQRTTKDLDMVLLTRSAYENFSTLLDSRERIVTNRGGGESLLVNLGFGSVTNFEGVDVTWEEGVDSTDSNAYGFGLTFDTMELCTPLGQLFDPAPIDFAIENLSDRYLVRSWCQLKLNPRHLMKIDA